MVCWGHGGGWGAHGSESRPQGWCFVFTRAAGLLGSGADLSRPASLPSSHQERAPDAAGLGPCPSQLSPNRGCSWGQVSRGAGRRRGRASRPGPPALPGLGVPGAPPGHPLQPRHRGRARKTHGLGKNISVAFCLGPRVSAVAEPPATPSAEAASLLWGRPETTHVQGRKVYHAFRD